MMFYLGARKLFAANVLEIEISVPRLSATAQSPGFECCSIKKSLDENIENM